ncbi:MAG TPA: YdbL family protein [Candidatus Limnocylindrales bacterium]|nr:YdbL family protein [Candidatus Limnocylindrales bacterium]
MQRRNSIRSLALMFAMAAASACVTVNIYFPAPQVREAAEQIVEETWGDAAKDASVQPRSSLSPGRLLAMASSLLVADAHAADPDVNVSTPAIRALKDAIKARSAQLRPYMNSGAVGIDRGGVLVARDLAGLDLAGKAAVRRLVEAENRDRTQLYREIAAANGYGSERVRDIQQIFAETWVAKAEPGWWVQDAGGTWRRR